AGGAGAEPEHAKVTMQERRSHAPQAPCRGGRAMKGRGLGLDGRIGQREFIRTLMVAPQPRRFMVQGPWCMVRYLNREPRTSTNPEPLRTMHPAPWTLKP